MMLPLLGVLAYAAATSAALRGMRAMLPTAVLAVALHAAALAQATLGGGGLHVDLLDAVSLVLWQAAVLLLLARRAMPIGVLAAVVFPLAAIALLAEALVAPSEAMTGITSWRIQLHAGLSVFAAGLFTLAALQSLLVALQVRYLHGHEAAPRWAQGLPPLQSMERALFRALVLAWAVLGAALLTGVVFVDDLLAQHLAHKTVLSILSWVVFAILLWGHWRHGWRGRTALRWIWSGYGVLLLAYFGSKFVLEQLLGQRWG